MISVEISRSGHQVLRKNNRLLASSFDPIKEATAWAEQVVNGSELKSAEQKCLETCQHFIVLGLGSGYHVLELAKRTEISRIVVIESDHELIREAMLVLPELMQVKIIVEADWLNLAANDSFRDAISSPYKIAVHGASSQIEPTFFRDVERLLIGRDKISFLLQLKARPDFWALLDPAKVSVLSDELISIKTVQKIFRSNELQNRERRIWRVLEELVV